MWQITFNKRYVPYTTINILPKVLGTIDTRKDIKQNLN